MHRPRLRHNHHLRPLPPHKHRQHPERRAASNDRRTFPSHSLSDIHLLLLHHNLLLHLLVLDRLRRAKPVHILDNHNLHHDLNLRDQFRGCLFELSGCLEDVEFGHAGGGKHFEPAASEHGGGELKQFSGWWRGDGESGEYQ
jgi:hypothetical protein